MQQNKKIFTQKQLLSFNRRAFVASGIAFASLPFGSQSFGIEKKNVPLSGYPFTLGVASGDPSSTGIVIWTRLAPRPLAPDNGMPNENVSVSWSVAKDEAMKQVVQKGTTTANPEFGFSVHVEVDGLEPNRWYYYQFQAAGEVSPVGRTKTAPAPDDKNASFNFAFASCQHYEQGYFNAFTHMAQEDLDLILHLGDYIYEYGAAASKNNPRKHVGKSEIKAIEDYRIRYSQYRTDPDLQLVHRFFPWAVTWDDHEFDNNYSDEISEESGVDLEEFLKRRAIAYKTYFEFMPLRKRSLPKGHDMLLYRKLPFGHLANFFVLDTRQYRTDQPCGDGNGPPCDDVFDPNASLLGKDQKDWLFNGLKKSNAKWNILAQQVMVARVDKKPGQDIHYSRDQWGGYDHERTEMLQYFKDSNVSNPIVLTGDIHSNWANNLKVNFDKPDSETVATEFVTTSISSGGNGYDSSERTKAIQSENPFVKLLNINRGYVKCSLSEEKCETKFQTVPRVDVPHSELITRATFVVEDGNPGAQEA